MRAFAFLRRMVGLYPKREAPGDKAGNVIKAPPWLVERMEKIKALPPPTREEMQAQMQASAWMRKLLDRGLTDEQIEQALLDHSDLIRAQIQTPWRKRVGENAYEGLCGCIFNSDGKRIQWCCGEH
ncbi:MAG: hypothetical protein AB7O65_09840 [Candidatus Korobacteraceae bacterium]